MKNITFKRLMNAVISRIPYLKKINDERIFNNAARAWKKVIASYDVKQQAVARSVINKVLIVPSDPYTLTGSRGDEAMLNAFIETVMQRNPHAQIAMVTATDAASAFVKSKGCYPVQMWTDVIDPAQVAAGLKNYAPDAVVGLGADVMDGYYHSANTLALLIYCDIAARLGMASGFLGFSFNASPSQDLKVIFDEVDARVRFNVRDIVSLQRFKVFTTASAHLVADIAFCLKPDTSNAEIDNIRTWVSQRRALGDTVVIFNAHPMLIKHANAQQIEQIAHASAAMLASVSHTKKVSWLLLPHDYRSNEGDNKCLKPIAEELHKRGLTNFKHVTSEPSAAALKAISGLVDGVVTGRMHLAIASLGMGVPVLALTYQDKFQGLFAHFTLPEWLLLSSDKFLDVAHFTGSVERFIDELAGLRKKVADHLPQVQKLSQENIDFITKA